MTTITSAATRACSVRRGAGGDDVAPCLQEPLISQRVVDNSDVSDSDLERMLDMAVRALGAAGIDHDQ